MDINTAVASYKDHILLCVTDDELPDWVKAVRYALERQDDTGLKFYLPWVRNVYDHLRWEGGKIAHSDEV